MLVCNVSMRPPGRSVAADLAEMAVADDMLTTGTVVFATLVDDPASVDDRLDAYLGEIMLEAASADAVATAGLDYIAAIDATVTAADTQDGTVTTAPAASTWNPSDKAANAVLSNGNLTVASSSSTSGARGTKGITSGKVYFELTASGSTSSGASTAGVATGSASLTSFAAAGQITVGLFDGTSYYNGGGSGLPTLGAIAAGDKICVAIDFANQRLWFRKNGNNWNATAGADPATNTGGLNISTLVPSNALYPVAIPTSSPANNFTGNFGASAFSYSVPSGFVAWG
jgi:hypothetical protein